MGCDIHMFTEALKTVDKKPTWVNVDNWRVNPFYKEGNEDGERPYDISELHGGRNYTLFSILAGVRDYSDKTKPVADPRGFPEDASPQTTNEYQRWEGDGHTHSWLTLQELMDYQANSPDVTYSGLVTPEEAEILDKGEGFPTSWCQWASNSNLVHREWTEKCNVLVPLIEKMKQRMKDEFWIWSKEDDYDQELNSKIRIVFWFDN